MKAQEVILKVAAGKLKWWEAAETMGVTDRTMRRWRERLHEHGCSGLWDYRKRSPSPKRWRNEGSSLTCIAIGEPTFLLIRKPWATRDSSVCALSE